MPGRKRDMPAAAAADGRDRCHAQTARTDGHAAKTCSGPIKLPIPFDEALDEGLDLSGGLESEVMHQGIEVVVCGDAWLVRVGGLEAVVLHLGIVVGGGGGQVALLEGYHVFFRFFTQAL